MAQYKNFFLRQIVSQSTYHILFCTFVVLYKKYIFRKSKSTYSLSPKCPHDPYRKKKKKFNFTPFQIARIPNPNFWRILWKRRTSQKFNSLVRSSDYNLHSPGYKGYRYRNKKAKHHFRKIKSSFRCNSTACCPLLPPPHLSVYILSI